MLGYFLVVSVAFGFAYLIAGTGKALWRAIAGVFLGLIVGWVGGTTVIALVLSAGELGHNSFPRIFGTSFWWALLGSGYGVYRARKKLKTVNASNGNASQKVTNAKNTTNDAYAAALAEIEEGRIDKGAWARAFAESGGDESKAKALYIKARAEAINSLPAWHDTQPRAEDSPISRDEPGSTTNLPASKPTGLYESALGEKNLGYYLAKFQAFDEMGPGLHASWNWPAFFFTGFWALYRKMYGWFVAWVFILTFFGMAGRATLNSQEGAVWVGVANLAVVLGFAAIANSLYHAKIKSRIDSARQVASDAAQVNRRLSSSAGVNAWVTYTFGWIPVLGIVLAVALPAYQDYTKRQAVAASPAQVPNPQGVTTPPVTRSQIDEFLQEKPSSAPASSNDGSYGENDTMLIPQKLTGPYLTIWSGNLFDSLDSVDAVSARARHLPYINNQDAWNAVLEWQAFMMRGNRVPANVALYDAVGLVTNGIAKNKGVCRPGKISVVDATLASSHFPIGTEYAERICEHP